ncbi:MAG: ComEC/Rec2 family competence protein [Candidatus Curtissbacteria bacterium]|nr:ComEC/Rec2 family competence protein [Candidatus Curtissbacteria bacterium]
MYRKKLPVYFVTLLVLIFSFGARIWLQEPEVTLPKNQEVTVIATVLNEPGISYNKQVIEVGDGKAYADLFPKYRVGDRLRIEGKVDEKGRIFNAKIELVGHVSSIMYQVASIREEIVERINTLLPSREATLVVGTVLGVDDISQEFRDQLIKTGTIHIVVVSGQNLMIVAAIFMSLSKWLGRRFSLFLAITAVFLYALLAGFEPPVVRASLMVLASSLAIFWGRESFALLNLLIAALVILFVWPQAIFEVSFQLTFAASLGIMTLGRWLSSLTSSSGYHLEKRSTNLYSNSNSLNSVSLRVPLANLFSSNLNHNPRARSTMFLRWLPSLLVNVSAIPLSAFLFTAPVIFYHFQRISLWSPVTNVLVAEAVAPIMILGFMIAVASLIFMPLAQLLAYFAFVPAFYFVKVVETFSKL